MRTSRDGEDAIVPLRLFSLAVLLNLQDANYLASQHQTGERRRLMYHHNVQGIAILGHCCRDKAPIIRIGQAGQEGFRQSKGLEIRIVVELRPAASRRLDNNAQVAVVAKGGSFKKLGILVAHRYVTDS
jgi:hypothetical protein